MIAGKTLPHGSTFYSESEFDLGKFVDLRFSTLELGRACVRKDFRNGTVMNLLWRGIGTHAKALGVRYLLGCSSVFGASQKGIQKIFADMESQGYVNLSAGVKPLTQIENQSGDDEPELSPLVRAYLRSGARVVSPPMYDSFFRCYDFLTLVDLEDPQSRFKRYQR